MSDSSLAELHRMVLEALPLALCVVNREGKVLLWSAGAEQMTGYFRQVNARLSFLWSSSLLFPGRPAESISELFALLTATPDTRMSYGLPATLAVAASPREPAGTIPVVAVGFATGASYTLDPRSAQPLATGS